MCQPNLKLSHLSGGTKTHIVAVIPGEEALRTVLMRKKIDADILELRIDRFNNLNPDYLIQVIKKLKEKLGLPIIATIRHKNESDFERSKHHLSEKERLNLFRAIIPSVDIVDIELQAKEIVNEVIKFAKQKKRTVLVSYHNFQQTPPVAKLEEIVRKAKALGADIIKLALYAKTFDDLVKLMLFGYSSPYKPLVLISLGKIGNISRIIGPTFGSCLTYGFVGEQLTGKYSLKELSRELHLFGIKR